MKFICLSFYCCLVLTSCNSEKSKEDVNSAKFGDYMEGTPSIDGTETYLDSPFVTAGDRVYMVGHQNGSFPEIGWHIKNEMGGIWDHPIKLMDGFTIGISEVGSEEVITLDQAHSFTNYPFANRHDFFWESKNIEIERWQFVPDGKEGMAVQLVVKNNGGPIDMELLFSGLSDLRPTWLGERTNMLDGKDMVKFNPKKDFWVFKDSLNPWFSIFGADLAPSDMSYGPTNKEGKGRAAHLFYNIFLKAKETKVINFTIAGSYTSETSAMETYDYIQKNYLEELIKKRGRYKALAEKSKLTIPDKEIEQAFEWIKYNCDWLVRTVPEIGSGITAGIPDYPWWFGVDSEYALQGYMAIGQTEPAYHTIRLLDSVSEVVNGNGRILHEMSTNGAVFNEGNVNETPQFASLIWKVYQWNGDRQFLATYFPTIEKGLNWLVTEKDKNGNLFPDGFGMMEIHGMDSEMIDVAVYTQKAFDDASKMATILGKTQLSNKYKGIAQQMKAQINSNFWSEEFNSYADFIGTDEQALHLIEDAIVRADTLDKPWAVAELEQTKKAILESPSPVARPFVLHHNWVVNTPMEMKIAPTNKAVAALTTAEKFVNPFGVFVTGIDRDASAGSDDGSFKGSEIFSYTGAVMTLPTAVQIVAENNYGRPDRALNYLKRMTRTFSYALPGSMYEVSPDYGMITQAWNVYGYGVPIVEQFFGVIPDAANKKVTIAPQMPSEWNTGSLENVQVGENSISIFYSEENGQTQLRVTQTSEDWTLEVKLPKGENQLFEVVPAHASLVQSDDQYIYTSQGNQIQLKLSHN
ncbi:MAG: glycogen debranching protein [Bacteroidota bacterium]